MILQCSLCCFVCRRMSGLVIRTGVPIVITCTDTLLLKNQQFVCSTYVLTSSTFHDTLSTTLPYLSSDLISSSGPRSEDHVASFWNYGGFQISGWSIFRSKVVAGNLEDWAFNDEESWSGNRKMQPVCMKTQILTFLENIKVISCGGEGTRKHCT